MLEVRDVQTYYGLSQILFGVSFNVQSGEVVGLLGKNGMGKTTTLRSIMGLTAPRSGSIRFKGAELVSLPPQVICNKGIGFVPEDRRIFRNLTVQENLEVASKRNKNLGQGGWTLDRVLSVFPHLRGMEKRNGATLSGGEQQMLTIARTLMGNPELLLLDEPSEGLAPVIVQQLQAQIADLKRQGLTIILCEQNLRFVMPLVDRVYIIEKGQMKYEGRIDEFRTNKDVQHTFLGV